MDHLSSNLLFEMMGYHPKAMFTIEVMDTKHRDLLPQRTDSLATLIEEVYHVNLRDEPYSKMKKYLESRFRPQKFFAGEKRGRMETLEGEAITI